MCCIMTQSLQGRGVPGQFVLSQRSGNVSLVPCWTAKLSPVLVCASSVGSRPWDRHYKCTGAKVYDRGTDYKVATSSESESHNNYMLHHNAVYNCIYVMSHISIITESLQHKVLKITSAWNSNKDDDKWMNEFSPYLHSFISFPKLF